MLCSKRVFGAIVLSCAIAVTSAHAQAPKPAPKGEPSISQTTEDVKAWTRKKWDAAKIEYAKNTAKWKDCRKKADARRLSGRASWSYLYGCMKR